MEGRKSFQSLPVRNAAGAETHLPSWGSPCTGEAGRAEALPLDSLMSPPPPQVLKNAAETQNSGQNQAGAQVLFHYSALYNVSVSSINVPFG